MGAPCQRHKCGGHVVQMVTPHSVILRQVVQQEEISAYTLPERHTGLLGGDEREKLEEIFKRPIIEQMPWITNVLSCTHNA
jgi:hypothetical protein